MRGGPAFDSTATYEPWPDLDAYGGYANYNPADETANFSRLQSTGRDLRHVAWTWDADYLYVYTGRLESSNNIDKFIFYADTNNNGRMEAGEPVVVSLWQGSNRTVSVYVGVYDGLNDPMVDTSGYGDGYSLPGDLTVPTGGDYNYQGTFGSADGLSMEWRVSWAELGLTGPHAMNFHVSSTNSQPNATGLASKIDDNLAGCGGGPGIIDYVGMEFVPDRSLTGSRNETVVAAHTITNNGLGSDVYDLTYATAGDFTPTDITFYFDNDDSGTVTAGDTLMTDTNSDGNPDTGTVAALESLSLVFTYTIPNTVNDAETATVTVTGTSEYNAGVSDQVVDTIEVALLPDLLVVKEAAVISDTIRGTDNPLSIPGAIVEYSITVTNQGGASPDAGTVVITDAIPANTNLVITDIAGTGSGPVAFDDGTPSSGLGFGASPADNVAYSNTAAAPYTFGYTPTDSGDGTDDAVTAIQVTPEGTMNADTGGGSPSFTLRFRVKVE